MNRRLRGCHKFFGSGTGFQLTAFNRHLIRMRDNNAFRMHQPRSEHIADVDPASFAPQ